MNTAVANMAMWPSLTSLNPGRKIIIAPTRAPRTATKRRRASVSPRKAPHPTSHRPARGNSWPSHPRLECGPWHKTTWSRDCVHNAAKCKNRTQSVQPARAAHGGDHRDQENQAQDISQKRGFGGRNAGTRQFDQRRHPYKQDACYDHPTNPDQVIFGG